MKKFLIIFNIFLLLFLSVASISKASNSINAYIFYGEGCPHCEKEISYLESIKDKYPNLKIIGFEIYRNRNNALFLQKVGQTFDADVGGVPFLVIGDKYFAGYSDSISPKEIENRIKECLNSNCSDSIAKILGIDTEEKQNLEQETQETKEVLPINNTDSTTEEQNQIEKDAKKISVPILGEIEVKNFSLPILTIVLASLDGLNPCAMWVLLFLISLLFGMKNKKRLWLFGLVFLIASAAVYFLFMTAWLSLFMFLGFILWVRLAIGGIALISGYLNLKEYITNSSGGCKITGKKKRRKVFESLKKIIQEKHLVVALLGLIVLAFAVNLIELVCSLGLPTVYIQILSLSGLSSWLYYFYLIFYVFIFILPAFVIFSVSAVTLQLTGISTKYGRICHLVGGIIMSIIGILMIFKPQWLMFG